MNKPTATGPAGTANASGSLRGDEPVLEIPPGHIGPVRLAATGRTVWWTGRVAIGLRYEPPPGVRSPD